MVCLAFFFSFLRVMSFCIVYEFTFVLLEGKGKTLCSLTCWGRTQKKQRYQLSFIIKTHACEVYYLSFIIHYKQQFVVRSSNTDMFCFPYTENFQKKKLISFYPLLQTDLFCCCWFFLFLLVTLWMRLQFSSPYFILLTTTLLVLSKGSL